MMPVHAVPSDPSIIKMAGLALSTLPMNIITMMPKKPTVTVAASIGGIRLRVVACISRADFLSSTSSFSKFRPSSCACYCNSISAILT